MLTIIQVMQSTVLPTTEGGNAKHAQTIKQEEKDDKHVKREGQHLTGCTLGLHVKSPDALTKWHLPPETGVSNMPAYMMLPAY